MSSRLCNGWKPVPGVPSAISRPCYLLCHATCYAMLLAMQYLGDLQLQPSMCYYSWYYGTLTGALFSSFMACLQKGVSVTRIRRTSLNQSFPLKVIIICNGAIQIRQFHSQTTFSVRREASVFIQVMHGALFLLPRIIIISYANVLLLTWMLLIGQS